MKRKFLATILTFAMAVGVVFTGSGTTVMAAESVTELEEKIADGDQMEFVQISDEELPENSIPEEVMNVVSRQFNGVAEIDIATYADEVDTTNTNPSYAIPVSNDSVYQGAIESENEVRWYTFTLSQKSTVTIFMQMADTMDADLYICSDDFTIVGGSASEGAGVSELAGSVLDSGTYYVAIEGYEGTGNFAFMYFQSSIDADYEINDSASSATNAAFNSSITGVIDSPVDIDYYKLTVTNTTIMRYSILSSMGYSFLYAGKSGDNAAIYAVNGDVNMVKMLPGTYYFAVLSEDNQYSATSTYTINFNKIAELANGGGSDIIGICEKAGIVFQADSDGSNCYVNGNPIDYSYSCVNNLSNSAGSQSYNITIRKRNDVYAYLGDGEFAPSAVYYHSSTRPAMNVGSRPALELTFYSDTDFYSIHCRCTGAYDMNNFWDETNVVQVLIDPSTGKLIDIVQFNYYYDFAPMGTNYITITRPYTMTFYQ